MKMNKEIVIVRLSDIIPNRFQPRLAFDEEALNELADSIREHGIIQPLILRDLGNKYEIIAGERRYKAAQLAGATEVPAVIGIMDDQTSAELALIENIQRKDLSAIEEAKSYKKILDMGDLTQEELAKRMGKSQSTIANKMRLLTLTNEAQMALINNLISERHARCLLQIKDENVQKDVLNKIISERMTVRDTDNYIKELLGIIKDGNTEEKEVKPELSETKNEDYSKETTYQEENQDKRAEDENPNVYVHSKNTDFIDINSLTTNKEQETSNDFSPAELNENVEDYNPNSDYNAKETTNNQIEETNTMFNLPTMPEMNNTNNDNGFEENYSEEQPVESYNNLDGDNTLEANPNSEENANNESSSVNDTEENTENQITEYYDNQDNGTMTDISTNAEENIEYALPSMPESAQEETEYYNNQENDNQVEMQYDNNQYQQEYEYNPEETMYADQEYETYSKYVQYVNYQKNYWLPS